MRTSKFISKILGLVYLGAGLGYLISTEHYQAMLEDFISKPSYVVMLTAYLTIIAGLAILEFHNIWKGLWRGAITFIGWTATIFGVILLIFPNFYDCFTDLVQAQLYYTIGGAFAVLIGLYFGYYGFFWKEESKSEK